jgi:hypothetical protein
MGHAGPKSGLRRAAGASQMSGVPQIPLGDGLANVSGDSLSLCTIFSLVSR